MSFRLSLLFLSSIAFAQTLPRPAIGALEFPLVESPIVYGIIQAFTSISGVNQAINTAARSDDNGANWTPLYVFPRGEYQFVDRILVHPDRPQLVYALVTRARGGLFRSDNGGRTWTSFVAGLPATGDIVDPVILRGASESARLRIGDTLYRLDESTASWTKFADLPTNTTVLAYKLADPQRVAVLARSGAFYFSTNGGSSWEYLSRIGTDPRKFGLHIAFDPRDVNILYVRAQADGDANGRCEAPGGGLWRSADGGRTFINVYATNSCNVSPIIFIDPSRPNVYIRSSFSGQPYCLSTNRGISFECVSEPIQATTPILIGMNPRNGDLYRYALSQVSRDGLSTWQNFAAVFRPTLRNFPVVTATIQEGESLILPAPLGLAEGAYSVTYRATTSGEPWLQLGGATGNFNAPISLRFNGSDLNPGTYRASVRLESSETSTNSTSIPISLSISPRASTGLRYSFERISGGSANTGKPIVENVPAIEQALTNVRGAARDAQGNLYVMSDRRLRRIDTNGRIQTVAGNGQSGTTPDNTPVADARFGNPAGVAIGGDGTIFVAENFEGRIYAIRDGVVRVVADRSFVTVAGNFPTRLLGLRSISASPQGTVYAHDGIAVLRMRGTQGAELFLPLQNFTSQQNSAALFDIVAESDNSFLFSAPLTHQIYRLANGRLLAVAGTGTQGLSGDGGPAVNANLNGPRALTSDSEGNIIFSDSGNNRIRAIRPDGRIFSISSPKGPPFSSSANSGTVSNTAFSSPVAFARAADNGLFVAEFSGLFRFSRLPFSTPAIQPGAAVHSASGQPVVSPGSLMTLYGSDLSLETQAASFAPLPTVLAGAEILLNGRPIPITFASPGQVNAQVPPATAIGTAKIQSRVDGKTSAEIQVLIAEAAPGIFAYGDNRAVAQNQNGAINGPDSPETPGNYAVLYLTGIGVTDVVVAPGEAAPSNPLARPFNNAEVKLDGVSAEVLFTGLTPGFIGLAQINFRVPEIDAGDHGITVTMAGIESNSPLFRVGLP